MEERLVKAERLASIGELAGQIGHDLRNPLTGIKSCAYILRKKGIKLTESEIKRTLDIIDNSVEDSDRIINGLIEYSTEVQLVFSQCSPMMLLLDALKKTKIPKRIQVINNLTDEPKLFVDMDKIESTFIKIITNAVEAMPNDGTLEIRGSKIGANYEIFFTDSGNGMSPEVLEKIFSPLATTKAKGMGLGLAISKRIVEAHEGRISVENVQGRGVTFTISLPIDTRTRIAKTSGVSFESQALSFTVSNVALS